MAGCRVRIGQGDIHRHLLVARTQTDHILGGLVAFIEGDHLAGQAPAILRGRCWLGPVDGRNLGLVEVFDQLLGDIFPYWGGAVVAGEGIRHAGP